MPIELKPGADIANVTTLLNTVAHTLYNTWKSRNLDNELFRAKIGAMLREKCYNADAATEYALVRVSHGQPVEFRVEVGRR